MIVALVSTDGQTVDARVNAVARRQSREDFSRDGQRSQDRPAGAGEGVTRPWRWRHLACDEPRPAGAIHTRPLEHPRHDHESRSRIPFAWRRMGRHHDAEWSIDVDGSRRPCRIRAQADPRSDQRRSNTRQSARRPQGTPAAPHHAPEGRGCESYRGRHKPTWRGSSTSRRARFQGRWRSGAILSTEI
jgi:hypothetical protein